MVRMLALWPIVTDSDTDDDTGVDGEEDEAEVHDEDEDEDRMRPAPVSSLPAVICIMLDDGSKRLSVF